MRARAVGRRFHRDRSGNIAVMTALGLFMMIGFAALSIDVGKFFVERRHAQSAVDLAALAAASDVANAPLTAAATVAANSINLTAPLTIDYGTYTPDGTLAPADRFRLAPAATANAVRITLQTQTPMLFGRVLTGRSNVPIKTIATASTTAFAAFAIGSRLVNVNGGLLNQILGALLGTNLSLSAMDYQSLISTRISVFDLMNGAAARAGLTGPTYANVMASNVTVANLLGAMIDIEGGASANGAASNALRSVAAMLGPSSSAFAMGSMINVGPYASLPLGQRPTNGGTVSLLDVLTAAAQLANGQHQVSVGLDLHLPGIAQASLSLAIGERPVGSSWFAIGMQGISVHTAQTRLMLQVQMQGLGPTPVLNVPIYVEVAQGTATLGAVSCGFQDITTSSVTLAVTPGIVDAWIGNVSNNDFVNFTYPVNPGAATLVSTLGLSVTGRAHVTMDNINATNVTFGYADIAAATPKTVTTTDYTSSLVGGLIGGLMLNVSFGDLGLNLPGPVTQSVAASLQGVAVPLDQTLAALLATVGIGLGQADVWVTGVRCDGGVLVN